MITNGIEHDSLHFDCPECFQTDKIIYTYKDTNKAIQARCACGKWIGNVKYDPRSTKQIRKDGIKEWLKRKEDTANETFGF